MWFYTLDASRSRSNAGHRASRLRRRALALIAAYCVVVAGLRGEFAAALSGGADSDEDRLACVGIGVVVAG